MRVLFLLCVHLERIPVYNKIMATIYLPLGYPLLSGYEFETVVYQGKWARKYVVPNDPRTDKQEFVRYMFADYGRMAAALGPFGKGIIRGLWGRQRTTLLRSLLQADLFNFRSERVEEWEGFSAGQKTALIGVAPSNACYNDPGMIYWSMYSSIWDWVQEQGLVWTHMPEPNITTMAGMYSFAFEGENFILDWLGFDSPNTWGEEDMNYTGSWNDKSDGSATDGTWKQVGANGATCEFMFLGRYCNLRLVKNVVSTSFGADVDGTYYTGGGFTDAGVTFFDLLLGPFPYGMHSVKMTWNKGDGSQAGGIDGCRVVRFKADL